MSKVLFRVKLIYSIAFVNIIIFLLSLISLSVLRLLPPFFPPCSFKDLHSLFWAVDIMGQILP